MAVFLVVTLLSVCRYYKKDVNDEVDTTLDLTPHKLVPPAAVITSPEDEDHMNKFPVF